MHKSPIRLVPLDEFRLIIGSSDSYRDALDKLGVTRSGGNYLTLKRRIADDSIDDSHIRNAIGKRKPPPRSHAIPLSEILKKGTRYPAGRLLKRLVSEGIKTNQCETCGQQPVWNGKPLTLTLHHKNGDSTDNRLENLSVSCLHCHSQTDSYCGRKLSKKKRCVQCGTLVRKRKKSGKCMACIQGDAAKKRAGKPDPDPNWRTRARPEIRKVERPTKTELAALIEEMSWAALGRKYGVSDNAVRKWAKQYGLL